MSYFHVIVSFMSLSSCCIIFFVVLSGHFHPVTSYCCFRMVTSFTTDTVLLLCHSTEDVMTSRIIPVSPALWDMSDVHSHFSREFHSASWCSGRQSAVCHCGGHTGHGTAGERCPTAGEQETVVRDGS